jgi:hypothetical protein
VRMVELNEGGWVYARMPQGLLILSPEEWAQGLRRGRLQRVADIIKLRGWIARRDLLSSTRYSGQDLDELCETLTGMGRIRPEPGKRGGKGWEWVGSRTPGVQRISNESGKRKSAETMVRFSKTSEQKAGASGPLPQRENGSGVPRFGGKQRWLSP